MSAACPHCGGEIAVQILPSIGPVGRIQQEVAHFYGLSLPVMLSDRRDGHLARARQMAMYLARETTAKSLPFIASRFNRDHTTVMWAIKAVKQRIAEDAGCARDVEVLRMRLAA